MRVLKKLWKKYTDHLYDSFLGLIESRSGNLSCWAWNKRWNKRHFLRHVGGKTGKIYTISKRTGAYKK